MSDKWNKNQWRNQLDSMFSDLDDTEQVPGLTIFNQQNGWIWKIDASGIFTDSSPEVIYLLGIETDDLLGQNIMQISNLDISSASLPRSQEKNEGPTHLQVIFYHKDGMKIKSDCHVLPQFDDQQEHTGWRGITLVQATEKSIIIPEEKELREEDLPLPLKDLLSQSSQEKLDIPSPDVPVNVEDETDLTEEKQIKTGDIPNLEFQLEVPTQSLDPAIAEFLSKIDDDPNRLWEQDEIQLVVEVQNQLELALENANLFQQTQQALAETDEQARRLRLLNELSERLSQLGNLLETYQQTAISVLEIFNAAHVNIAIWSNNKDALEICAASGENADFLIGNTITPDNMSYFMPIKKNLVQILTDFNHPLYPGINAIMVGPIYASGEIQGSIFIAHSADGQFGERDKTFLNQILSILSAVIENRNLFEAIEKALATTEEQARRLAELNQLSEMLGQSSTFHQVLELSMDRVDRIIPSMVCRVILNEKQDSGYTIYETTNSGVIELGKMTNTEDTLLELVLERKRAITIEDLQNSDFTDVQQLASSHNVLSMITAPLITGEEAMGAILVANHKDFGYTSQDETLLMSISSILASTLDNRQLFDQIHRRSTQLETSAEVSRIASTILDPDELLPEVVELIKTGFNLYYAGIFLIDEDGELTGEPNRWAVLQAGSGMPGQQMLEAGHKLVIGGDSMIGTAIMESKPRIAQDVGEEARFFRNPYLPETRSEMALPLVSRGQVLGAITIQSERGDAFSQEDVTSLQTMADQIANAIENARLFEQTQLRAEELTVLNEMARAYTQTIDLENLVESSLVFSSRLVNANNFYLALYNPETNLIEFKIFVEEGIRIPPPEPKIYLGEGLTDWIITNQLPVLIPDNVEHHLRSMGIEIRGRSAESWLGVPMLIGSNPIGVIAVQSYDKEVRYTNRDLDLLSAVASQTAVAIDNALRFQQTQARARYEQILREITARVHTSTNAESILKTAVQEVSTALGREAYIELNLKDESLKGPLLDTQETPESPVEELPSTQQVEDQAEER